MTRPKARTPSCDRSDALNRLAEAESFLLAADCLIDR
jgi:hypothetical protein